MATSDIKKGPLYVDSTNNRVGVGTSSPQEQLQLTNSAGRVSIFMSSGSTNQGYISYFDATQTLSLGNASPTGTGVNGGQQLNISNYGYVTIPNQPAFYAYGSSTQNWSGTSAYQILQLGNQASLGSRSTGYNTSTYTFTAPVSGTYAFFGRMTQTGNATGPSLQLFVNGATVYNEICIGYNTSYMATSGFQLVQLAANDAVTLRVINYNNTTVTLDTSRCAFMGWLFG